MISSPNRSACKRLRNIFGRPDSYCHMVSHRDQASFRTEGCVSDDKGFQTHLVSDNGTVLFYFNEGDPLIRYVTDGLASNGFCKPTTIFRGLTTFRAVKR